MEIIAEGLHTHSRLRNCCLVKQGVNHPPDLRSISWPRNRQLCVERTHGCLAYSSSCQRCDNHTWGNEIDVNATRPDVLSRTSYQSDYAEIVSGVGCLYRVSLQTAHRSHKNDGAASLTRHELERVFGYVYGTSNLMLMLVANPAFQLTHFDAVVPFPSTFLR